MRQACLAAVATGLVALCGAAPALAQDVDRVDRITGTTGPGGSFRAPEGVKVVSPGAMVFASFDSNFDGRITQAEIDAGSQAVFKVADRNGDGAVTGFEQTDWAGAMADPTGMLANAMTFDIDLDRSVTQKEFTTGLKRIAGQINSDPDGDLLFKDLVQPLNRGPEQSASDTGGWGTIRPRGQSQGGGRNVSGVVGQ